MKSLRLLAFLLSAILATSFVSCGSDEPLSESENPMPTPPDPDQGNNDTNNGAFKIIFPDMNYNHTKEDVEIFEKARGSKLDSKETMVTDEGYQKLQFNTKNPKFPIAVYWIHPNTYKLIESRVICAWNDVYGDLGDLGTGLLPEVEEYLRSIGFVYLGIDTVTGAFGFYRGKDRVLLNMTNYKSDGSKVVNAMLCFTLNQDNPNK